MVLKRSVSSEGLAVLLLTTYTLNIRSGTMIGIDQHDASNKSAKIDAQYIAKVQSIEKGDRIFHETSCSEPRRNRHSHHAGGG